MTKDVAKSIAESKAYQDAMRVLGALVGWGKVMAEFKDGKIVMSRFETDIKH
jgi:hypothetical protein